jgi:hypothetical protein
MVSTKEIIFYTIYLAAKGIEALAHRDRLKARIYFGKCVLAFCYIKSEILHKPLTDKETELMLSLN